MKCSGEQKTLNLQRCTFQMTWISETLHRQDLDKNYDPGFVVLRAAWLSMWFKRLCLCPSANTRETKTFLHMSAVGLKAQAHMSSHDYQPGSWLRLRPKGAAKGICSPEMVCSHSLTPHCLSVACTFLRTWDDYLWCKWFIYLFIHLLLV